MNYLKYITLIIILSLATGSFSWAQTKRRPAPQRQLEQGRKLLENKKYGSAALYFYNLLYGKSRIDNANRPIAKYYLGLSLSRAQLNQMGSFAFLSATEDGNKAVAQKSFEQLVKSAQILDDQTLLNYSLKKTEIGNLTEVGREYFLNNLALLYLDQRNRDQALKSLDQALQINPENEESLYLKGLTYVKSGEDAKATPYFETLYKRNQNANAKSREQKDEAIVALARVNYNLKNWPTAIELYREIPKDSHLFRQVLKELSWAYFRNGQFRSALSVLQSLNTPYYENFYDPESWALRSIILLFICQPEELERSVQFFDKFYVTAYSSLRLWNEQNHKDEKHFTIVAEMVRALEKNKDLTPISKEIPFFFFRTLLENPDISQKFSYLNKLKKEKQILNTQFKSNDHRKFNAFGNKILNLRIKSVSNQIGRLVKQQLKNLEVELSDYVTQFEFINYEFLDIKKHMAKKVYLAQGQPEAEPEIRKIMIESGFQYYPFEGEYWRDELGNYQYLGKNQCDYEN